MRLAMLQNLDAEFGDYNSNIFQYQGQMQILPVTAELSEDFNKPCNLTEKFLSFDSEDEQKIKTICKR